MGEPGRPPTPQARKLGLKAGQRVLVDGAPAGWRLEEPPDGVEIVRGDGGVAGSFDVVLGFVPDPGRLGERLPGWGRSVHPDGAVWVMWPRRAVGHLSDVTENGVRDAALVLGLVDVKVAAVDHDWSGLRVVWRVENRPAGARARRGRSG